MHVRALRVPVAAALVAGVIGVGGWLDYRATSRELRGLRRSEADTLYETIAAAARVQHAAATAAEAALGQRLLDQARFLAAMDRRTPLDARTVGSLVSDARPFRVMVFDADGRRQLMAGESPQGLGGGQDTATVPRATHAPGEPRGWGQGRGRGGGPGLGRHEGRGGGFGPPPGASRVAQRLFAGESEVVTEPHAGPAGAERVAAGVRRERGGVIVVNAANQLASELDSVYSLDALISRIAGATPALAYIILHDQENRVARGPLAAAAPDDPAAGRAGAIATTADDVPVLERHGPVALDEARQTLLRVGMRLDDVKRAERQAMLRIGGGLGALGVALLLAVALGGLRQRYGSLSERHARAEEALRRRDRLTAMGELASTVAHEIRNPLNAIAMSAQRLVREYPATGGGEARDLVDVIQREASRIDGRVRQFLEFARPRPIDLREIDVPALIAEVAAAAAPLAATRSVGIHVRAVPSLALRADSDQLREALDNLVRNAIEATPAGGRVALSAERRGKHVVIRVEDTGAGIPADVVPRIFDLYFTTKRDGTGVGLALVHQVVSAHGGTVSVESQPGAGTRMAMELPQHGPTDHA